MIKIKLLEKDIHRNETTFRPFLFAQHVLKEVGIEFTDGDSYDYAWIGQASIIDKETSLEKSIEKGVEFVSKITGDYMIVDGQDATSLIGTVDVLRMYWGEGDYSVPDIDDLKSKMKLTGCNWVGTIQPKWFEYFYEKKYDIACMFSWGDRDNYEYLNLTSKYYDEHRRILLETLDKTDYNVVKREAGIVIPQDQFYKKFV